MKKAILLLTVALVLVLSAVCVSATEYVDYTPTGDKYTIIYNVGESNTTGMYGMVAIKGTNTIIDTSNLGNIYYIDQASADADGNISFVEFTPKGILPTDDNYEECTVYIGGPGFPLAEKIGYLKKGEKIVLLIGDIDGNGKVTYNDAIVLFQHSMFPNIYQIEYAGSVDFDKNDKVTYNDAIVLFQHSMFPNIYPLG